jgi:hypothetical protein
MSYHVNNHKIEFIYELKCYQHKRINADAPKPGQARFGAQFIGVMWALAHRKAKYSWGLWKVLQLDVCDCFGFMPQDLRN